MLGVHNTCTPPYRVGGLSDTPPSLLASQLLLDLPLDRVRAQLTTRMSSRPAVGATKDRLKRTLLLPLLVAARESLKDAKEGASFPKSWSSPCCKPCCNARSGDGGGVGAPGPGVLLTAVEGPESVAAASEGPDNGAFTTRSPVNEGSFAFALPSPPPPAIGSEGSYSTKSMAASSAGTPHVRVQTWKSRHL